MFPKGPIRRGAEVPTRISERSGFLTEIENRPIAGKERRRVCAAAHKKTRGDAHHHDGMKRMTAIAVAVALSVVGLCGSARADEKPWRVLPTAPELKGEGGLSLLAASGNGEVWVAGSEKTVCAEIQMPPLGTSSLCSFDAAVQQWDGERWVDRRPPSAWGLKLKYMDASAPTNVWISGTLLGTNYLARWDGKRWHRALLPPRCTWNEPLRIAAVGAGDEVWGVSSSDCVVRHRNGFWKAYPGIGKRVSSLTAAGPNDLYFEVGTGDGAKVVHWDGSAFSDFPVPAGSAPIVEAARPGAVYFSGDNQGLRLVADGVTTVIPHAPSPIRGYKLGGDGTLWAFKQTAALRWDGTAWRSSPLPGTPVYWGFDVAPDSSGTAWDLGADGSVHTNG
jgi:hypothetical protein